MAWKKGKPSPRRLTVDQYKARLEEANLAHGNREVELLGDYLGMSKKTLHRCRGCGLEWKVSPLNLTHPSTLQGCPGCSVRKKSLSDEQVLHRLRYLQEIAEVKIKREAGRSSTGRSTRPLRILARCKACKHVWRPSPENYFDKKRQCPGCLGRNNYTKANFLQAAVKFGDRFTYPNLDSELTGSHGSISVVCKEHGEFSARAYVHLNSTTGACPHCRPDYSKTQSRMARYLIALGERVEVNATPFRSSRKEVDVYLPDRKLGIEVNGIYWHNDTRAPRYHLLEKTKLAAENGIRLIHFTDAELNYKPKIVGSMVRNLLGKAKFRLGARQTTVEYVAKADERFFLESNHLQGYVPSKKAYGLFYKRELVALMSIGKPRFGSLADWELLRFAVKADHVVSGGFSKLLKATRAEFSGQLVSYADQRYSQGKVYESAGFRLTHTSRPGYCYHGSKGIVVSRYAAQKHRLPSLLGEGFDSQESEYQNMLRNGYYRLWDCGQQVWMID